MAEIHDQFDTILILDFGSQVSSNAFTAHLWLKGLMLAVQPSYHTTMPRIECLRGADALYSEDQRSEV